MRPATTSGTRPCRWTCRRCGCSATSSSAAARTRRRSRCSSCSAPRRSSGACGTRSKSTARTPSSTRRGPLRTTTWTTTRSARAGSTGTHAPSPGRSPAAPPRSTATSSPSESSASPARRVMDDQILYEVTDKVAVITLNRPQKANAQTMELLDELDAAWEKAAMDDEVRVIVLRGNGKHFSAGHDLNSGMPSPEKITLEWIYKLEARRYLEYSLRWRNVPKP